MIIETSATADPNTFNFYTPDPLLPNEKVEFIDLKSIRKSPLAESIFDLGGISFITIHHDLVSITKDPLATWEELKPQIMATIMDFLTSGQPVLSQEETTDNIDSIQKIKGLLEARIRPAIQQDGGDIVFKHFTDGIVFVELKGNCVGCPYALRTLKEGVERILMTYIPEVKAVENFSEE